MRSRTRQPTLQPPPDTGAHRVPSLVLGGTNTQGSCREHPEGGRSGPENPPSTEHSAHPAGGWVLAGERSWHPPGDGGVSEPGWRRCQSLGGVSASPTPIGVHPAGATPAASERTGSDTKKKRIPKQPPPGRAAGRGHPALTPRAPPALPARVPAPGLAGPALSVRPSVCPIVLLRGGGAGSPGSRAGAWQVERV